MTKPENLLPKQDRAIYSCAHLLSIWIANKFDWPVLISVPDNIANHKGGESMLAVLIKRVLASEMETTYEEFSRKVIQAAVPAKGFISSKSFKDFNDSKIRYTLIQMESLADWKVWYQSDERQTALRQIEPLLREPEDISILTTA